MRLVFIHGINQQGKDADELRQVWINDLEKGMGSPGVLSGVDVCLPFYGDTLFNLANSDSGGAIAQGSDTDEDRLLAEFLAEGLSEYADVDSISAAAIREEQERSSAQSDEVAAVAQGFPMSRRLNAIVSLLEEISPFRGTLALRLLDQAYAYLSKPNVGSAVDEKVLPELEDGPIVLVTHSLGTVVGFKLLRALAQADNPVEVPLFVTLGSPLTLAAVQRALGPSFTTPTGVEQWINLRDPDDFISLNRNLGSPLFSPEIDNHVFENPGDDAHAIPGYLSSAMIATSIKNALGV